jgi:hypothetical protein
VHETSIPAPPPKAKPAELLLELFRLLPPPGAEWPAEQRAAWLEAAAANFDVLYGPVGKIRIVRS